jgi:hypothetical protein
VDPTPRLRRTPTERVRSRSSRNSEALAGHRCGKDKDFQQRLRQMIADNQKILDKLAR